MSSQKMTLPLGLVPFPPPTPSKSRETIEALVIDSDGPAFSFHEPFFLGRPLDLGPVETGAVTLLSVSGPVWLPVSAEALEVIDSVSRLRGVETNRRSTEVDLVPSKALSGTWFDLVASIRARRLFFLGLEREGEGAGGEDERDLGEEEDRMAILI